MKIGSKDWTDKDISDRTAVLIDAILKIWPAPENHRVLRNRETNRWSSSVSVSDLLSAGLLAPGQTLYSRPGRYGGFTATVLPDGRIEVEGEIKDSLSLAGIVVRKRNTNGWNFWRIDLQTQKSMDDLRHEYEAIMGIVDTGAELETEDVEEE